MPYMKLKSTFGPKMKALRPMEQAYVQALMDTGGKSHAEAARIAGYAAGSAHVSAHYLDRRPRVIEAIKEEAQRRLNAGAILAASAMVDIAMDPHHKDRFKAADRLLDRGGMIVATKHEVDVRDDRSIAQIEAFITQKAAALGIDPKKLLGSRSSVVALDAEFSEVSSEDDDLEEMFS